MLRFLILSIIVTAALAWDPHLKIAEKIAIPHHIRHSYEYPYINIAEMVNRNVRRGFSQAAPFDRTRSQSPGFRQAPAAAPARPLEPSRGFQSQPLEQNRGFQSQPFEQNRGFRSSPVRQTRFFERINPNTRPDFGGARSNSFFNRRLS